MDDVELKAEMLELTLAHQQGDATPEEHARLERLLSDDTRAVGIYLQIVEDSLTLRDATAARENEGQIGENVESGDDLQPAAQKERKDRDKSRAISRGIISLLALAVAACLALLMFGPPEAWRQPATAPAAVAAPVADIHSQSARVVSLTGVQWAPGAKHYDEWSYVRPGDTLKIKTGLVNLFLAKGVDLMIEGPANVDYVSPQKVKAWQGRLAARVGPTAVGFRIETPHATAIDRGTSLGVTVDDKNRTAVVVYQGVVDLDVLGKLNSPRHRLQTGEALSVSQDGELSRITTVQSDRFLVPPQVRRPDMMESGIIASVVDNIQSLETTKYYRIIRNGFQEDCRAYVDRAFEWNGIDDRGLPPYLVGGDYVMTFNDDKIVTEIRMALTVSQPANVYVIIDDRVPTPEWLKRDFVDTQWNVGSDEGYPDRVIETGIGPGDSVDHTCSVWRRAVPEPTTIVLGALSNEKLTVPATDVERSMYGIVVTPLARPDVKLFK